MTTKKTGAIPFGALFTGNLRNVRMALRDPKTPADLRAELERYMADPLKATVTDTAQGWQLKNRQGGTKDRKATKVQVRKAYIRDLWAAHPTFEAGQLYGVASAEEQAKCSESTFYKTALTVPPPK